MEQHCPMGRLLFYSLSFIALVGLMLSGCAGNWRRRAASARDAGKR
jgi:hypothetical protein